MRPHDWGAVRRLSYNFPHSSTTDNLETMSEGDYKKYECVICGFIYDEAEGLPDDGIPPGTRWEDIPEDWECPDCGISKADFDPYEE